MSATIITTRTKSATKPRAKGTSTSSRAKKQVETILDKKYASNKLEISYELSYDYDIKQQHLDSLGKKVVIGKPNLKLISKLPSYKIKTLAIDTITEVVNEVANEVEEEDCVETNIIDDGIDRDNLETETIGDKKYYLDHDKGIIYDMSYNNVGYIDEIGELVINE
jgi:hypothetical protein